MAEPVAGRGRSADEADEGPAAPVRCSLCGVRLADRDDVVRIASRTVHAPCAESAYGPRSGWQHSDVQAWSEWARGMGRAGGVTS